LARRAISAHGEILCIGQMAGFRRSRPPTEPRTYVDDVTDRFHERHVGRRQAVLEPLTPYRAYGEPTRQCGPHRMRTRPSDLPSRSRSCPPSPDTRGVARQNDARRLRRRTRGRSTTPTPTHRRGLEHRTAGSAVDVPEIRDGRGRCESRRRILVYAPSIRLTSALRTRAIASHPEAREPARAVGQDRPATERNSHSGRSRTRSRFVATVTVARSGNEILFDETATSESRVLPAERRRRRSVLLAVGVPEQRALPDRDLGLLRRSARR